MRRSLGNLAWFSAALCAAILQPSTMNAARADETVKKVFATQLPNVPGDSLTAILVTYKPGEKSASHHHAGSVFAYVLSGEIRSQVSTDGPAKVYKAGESFFEPPGSSHLVSENASATEPASLLAVFVAADHAKLTAPGEAP
ncbi:MAG TPA: cupin domain-containing protein [Dongiaceae bacterium]|jgi:quercetin dioxygenase-like cupin family protein|nr:cupin domain-containing protein [Dongiaceae bacterium]